MLKIVKKNGWYVILIREIKIDEKFFAKNKNVFQNIFLLMNNSMNNSFANVYRIISEFVKRAVLFVN